MSNNAAQDTGSTVDPILAEEFDHLGVKADDERWALCLSGGGIRSATFSLGVLQGLAEKKILGKFHYLSTVSGGGYIGSWLSSWIARCGFGRVQSMLAGEKATPANGQTCMMQGNAEAKPVSRLRAYGHYLSPVWGLSVDFLTLVSIFIRNLVLNWLVILPLLVAALTLPRIYLLSLDNQSTNLAEWLGGCGMILIMAAIINWIIECPWEIQANDRKLRTFFFSYFAPVCLGAILLSYSGTILLSYLGAIFPSFLGVPDWNNSGQRELYATLAVPLILIVMLTVATLYTGIKYHESADAKREWLARGGAWFMYAILGWLAVFAVVIYGPQLLLALPGVESNPKTAVAGGGIAGVIISLIGYLSKNFTEIKRRAQGLAATTGVRLLDLAAAAFILALLIAISLFISWGMRELKQTEEAREIKVEKVLTAITESAKSAEEAVRSYALFTRNSKKHMSAETPEVASARASATEAAFLSAQAMDANTTNLFTTKDNKPALPPEKGVEVLTRVAESAAKASKAIVDLSNEPEMQGENRKRINLALAYAAHSNTTLTRAMDLAANHAINREPKNLAAIYADGLREESILNLICLFLVTLGTGYIMSRRIGVNTFSLHNMYGNRLVRAYLGATNFKRKPNWFTGFDSGDNLAMEELLASNRGAAANWPPCRKAGAECVQTNEDCHAHEDGKPRLFHIINIALNVTRSSGDRLEWQQRKAEPFTISPLHAGGPYIGYARAKEYPSQHSPITLGRSMAISGAAASPNMGYYTSGVVAFVMTLFNVRLGYWMPNPGKESKNQCSPLTMMISKILGRPGKDSKDQSNGLTVMIKEFLGCSRKDSKDNGPEWGLLYEAFTQATDNSAYVYLSDGGHFENLGLYEMVRRGCRKIMVVDASGDPEYKFGDLEMALRKIRIDLGVQIEFDDKDLPNPKRAHGNVCHYAMGKIKYSDNPKDDGEICYIKPVLSGDEPIDVRNYAAKNEPFPHQSTADQFFDEAQFESYRALGKHSVDTMDFGTDLWPYKPWRPRRPSAHGQAAAAVVSKAEGESGREGSERKGLFARMGESIHSMGQSALVASTLAVGGAVGVGGVILSDPAPVTEVKISENDLKLVQNEITLQTQTINDILIKLKEIHPGEPPRVDLSGLALRLEAIESDLSALDWIVAEDISGDSESFKKINKGFQDLEDDIKQLKTRPRERGVM
jgi:hypothetical protein